MEAVMAVASHDPLITGLAWVVGIVTMLISIGLPIKNYIRNEKNADKVDKVGDAKAEAETTLYTQLAEQVERYHKIAEEATLDRSRLAVEVARLEERTRLLEDTKGSLDRLKDRLQEKDRKLEEKDAEIRKLLEENANERRRLLDILQSKDIEIFRRDERIVALEHRISEMELRLVAEGHLVRCPECPYLDKSSIIDITSTIPLKSES